MTFPESVRDVIFCESQTLIFRLKRPKISAINLGFYCPSHKSGEQNLTRLKTYRQSSLSSSKSNGGVNPV